MYKLFDVSNPDSKVHGANMGLTWVLLAPDGPHVGPMNQGMLDNGGAKGKLAAVCLRCHGQRKHAMMY